LVDGNIINLERGIKVIPRGGKKKKRKRKKKGKEKRKKKRDNYW